MDISGYRYSSPEASHAKEYLWPAVLEILDEAVRKGSAKRIFELGCGNGAFARELVSRGFVVTGVDPSEDGVRLAGGGTLGCHFEVGSSEDDLPVKFGTFPLLISLEVIEHVYSPRTYGRCVYQLLEPGGTALISTPYHGYIKNLALALTGKMDSHFTVPWDHGHLQFWSRRTLAQLLSESGFRDVDFHLVGRVPFLAKSMIAVVTKPGGLT